MVQVVSDEGSAVQEQELEVRVPTGVQALCEVHGEDGPAPCPRVVLGTLLAVDGEGLGSVVRLRVRGGGGGGAHHTVVQFLRCTGRRGRESRRGTI